MHFNEYRESDVRKQFLVGVAALLTMSAMVQAAIPWAVPAGDQGSFTYNDGQSLYGKFGDGTPTDSGFVLSPNLFQASANGSNSPVSTSDTTSVIVHADSIMRSVTATVFGDYTILGTGSIDAAGTLSVKNLDTLAVLSLPLTVSGAPSAVTNSSADGGFFASSTVSFPAGWANFEVQFTTTLTSTAGANGVALIEAKYSDIVIRNKLIPEPTSLAALGLLSVLGLSSRR